MTSPAMSRQEVYLLNGISPYYTMFPLEFPYTVLRDARPGDRVLDPFCGRGTTNYASRLRGLSSVGIDGSPVAAAIAQAKLVRPWPSAIVAEAQAILSRTTSPIDGPTGRFWERAYQPTVLDALCRLRAGLLSDCTSPARVALRAIVLGALHGPRTKGAPWYFSNQAPRTYAPKPRYAADYWEHAGLVPPHVDVLDLIRRRAARFYTQRPGSGTGTIICGDSRDAATYTYLWKPFQWVITSPPYYGMRTYIPDQWLRMWFLGGPPEVSYTMDQQLQHASPEAFAAQLRQVWRHVSARCTAGAQLIIRFGGINDRRADPLTILRDSLADTNWNIRTARSAGSAATGRRQADHFARQRTTAIEEHDVVAVWQQRDA